MWDKMFIYLFEEHRGKIIGVTLGLIVSILFIAYGFFKTLFVIFCIVAGYFIGKTIDENKKFKEWLKDTFSGK